MCCLDATASNLLSACINDFTPTASQWLTRQQSFQLHGNSTFAANFFKCILTYLQGMYSYLYTRSIVVPKNKAICLRFCTLINKQYSNVVRLHPNSQRSQLDTNKMSNKDCKTKREYQQINVLIYYSCIATDIIYVFSHNNTY